METMRELLVDEMRDIYDAEKQLTKALPKMAKAATTPNLKKAFEDHLRITQGQVTRLEKAFELLGEKAKSKPCAAMKGLIEEGQETIGEDLKGGLLDSALICAAQKVEHYEIAGYGTLRTLADLLGEAKVAKLLDQTLKEEEKTDKLLTQVAERVHKELLRKEQSNGAGEQKDGAASKGGAARNGRAGSDKAAQSASNSKGKGASKSGSRAGSGSGAGSRVITDHQEIQQWAEERGASPSCVRKTGGKGDAGVLRLDFPGFSGADSLEHIEWPEFFQKFDESQLALLVQDKTAAGKKSNFNKLVSRETAAEAGR